MPEMTTLKTITADEACSWGCCYSDDHLRKLYDRPCSALDVLERTDGPWAVVPPEDRLWTVAYYGGLSDRLIRLFAVWCARRALERERAAGREPDPRSWSAVEVAERFANGNATAEELDAARAAAWAAAWAAARDAARAAAWAAAWAAARAAAWDAARDAARAAAWDAQLRHLAKMIREEYGHA